MKQLVVLLLTVALISSCNKGPGEGGTSSITGKVFRIETNSLGQTLEEYYAADYDVYLLYGSDDQIYDDKFSTSSDGSYKFSNLLPGTYSVFAYTRCDLCPSGDTITLKTIEITDKATNTNVDDLIVYK